MNTQTQTQTQTTVKPISPALATAMDIAIKAHEAGRGKPSVKALYALAVSKVNAKDQATIRAAINKTMASKTASATPTAQAMNAKPMAAVFTLIAGTIRAISNKQIAGAMSYHVKLGNLEKTDLGVKLTAQGAAKFQVDRVAHSPELFQTIAAWMHRNGNTPPDVTRWDGQHKAMEIAAGVKFPNYIHWGSFASREMRLAFAAIWAK